VRDAAMPSSARSSSSSSSSGGGDGGGGATLASSFVADSLLTPVLRDSADLLGHTLASH